MWALRSASNPRHWNFTSVPDVMEQNTRCSRWREHVADTFLHCHQWLFPEMDNRTWTFQRFYEYSKQNIRNHRNYLLWTLGLEQAHTWLKNKPQFFSMRDEHVDYTTKWLKDQLDESVRKKIFGFAAEVLDWDENFLDKTTLRFW